MLSLCADRRCAPYAPARSLLCMFVSLLVLPLLLLLVGHAACAEAAVAMRDDDLPIKPWHVFSPASLPRPAYRTSLVAMNSSLVILGGCVEFACAPASVSALSNTSAVPQQYNTMLVLDLRTGQTREKLPSLPPLSAFGPFSGRYAGVAINSVIYLVRACTAWFEPDVGSGWVADDGKTVHPRVHTRTSEALGRVAAIYADAMFVNESFFTIPPERVRVNASCVAVGNRIYLVGGYLLSESAVARSVDALDVVTHHYYQDTAVLEEAVMSPALAAMSTGFVVVGGMIPADGGAVRASTLVTLFMSQAYGGVDNEFCTARLDPWWPSVDDPEEAFVMAEEQRQDSRRGRVLDTRQAPGLDELLASATWDSLHVFLFAAHVFILNDDGAEVLSMRLRDAVFDVTRAVEADAQLLGVLGDDEDDNTTEVPDTTTTTSPQPTTTSTTREPTTTTTTTTAAPPQPGEPTVEFSAPLIFGFPHVVEAHLPRRAAVSSSDTRALYNTTVLSLVRFGGVEVWTVRDVRTGDVLERVTRASTTVYARHLPDDDNNNDTTVLHTLISRRSSAATVRGSVKRVHSRSQGRGTHTDSLVLPTPLLPASAILDAPRGLLTLAMPDIDYRALCAPLEQKDQTYTKTATGLSLATSLGEATERCAVRVSGRRDCVGNAAGTLDVLYDGTPARNVSLSVSGNAYPVYICIAYLAHFPASDPFLTPSRLRSVTERRQRERLDRPVAFTSLVCPPTLWWTPVNLLSPLALEASGPPPSPPTTLPPPTQDPSDPGRRTASVLYVVLALAGLTVASMLLAALLVSRLHPRPDHELHRPLLAGWSRYGRGYLNHATHRTSSSHENPVFSLISTPPFAAPATESSRVLWWWWGPRQATPTAPPPPASALLAEAARHRARITAAHDVLMQHAGRYTVVARAGEGPSSLVLVVYGVEETMTTADRPGQPRAHASTSWLGERWDGSGEGDAMHLQHAHRYPYAYLSHTHDHPDEEDDDPLDENNDEEPLYTECGSARATKAAEISHRAGPPMFALKFIQCPRDSTRAAITRCCEQLRDLESYHPFLLRPFDLFVNYEVSFGLSRGSGGRSAALGGSARGVDSHQGGRQRDGGQRLHPWGAGAGARRKVRFAGDEDDYTDHGDDADDGEDADEDVMSVDDEVGADAHAHTDERTAARTVSMDRAASAHLFYWKLRQRRYEVMMWRATTPKARGFMSGLGNTGAAPPSYTLAHQPQQRYWSLCLVMQHLDQGNLEEYIAARVNAVRERREAAAVAEDVADTCDARYDTTCRSHDARCHGWRIMSECTVTSILYQLSSALYALHHHTTPMLHGDVKLTNVLLRSPRRGARYHRRRRNCDDEERVAPHERCHLGERHAPAARQSAWETTAVRVCEERGMARTPAAEHNALSGGEADSPLCRRRLPECVRRVGSAETGADAQHRHDCLCDPPRTGASWTPVGAGGFLAVVLSDAGMAWFATEELHVYFRVALSPFAAPARRGRVGRANAHVSAMDSATPPMRTASEDPLPQRSGVPPRAQRQDNGEPLPSRTSATYHKRDSSSIASSEAESTSYSLTVRRTETSLSLSPQGRRWRQHGHLRDLVDWMLLYVDVPHTVTPELVLMHALAFPEMFVNVPVPTAASPFLTSSAEECLAGIHYDHVVPYWPEQLILHGGLALPALQVPLQRRYLSGLTPGHGDAEVGGDGAEDEQARASLSLQRQRHPPRHARPRPAEPQQQPHGSVAPVSTSERDASSRTGRAPTHAHRPTRSPPSSRAHSSSSCSSSSSSDRPSSVSSVAKQSTATVSTATTATNATANTVFTRLSALERRSRRRRAPFQSYWHMLVASGTLADAAHAHPHPHMSRGGRSGMSPAMTSASSGGVREQASFLAWPPPSSMVGARSNGVNGSLAIGEYPHGTSTTSAPPTSPHASTATTTTRFSTGTGHPASERCFHNAASTTPTQSRTQNRRRRHAYQSYRTTSTTSNEMHTNTRSTRSGDVDFAVLVTFLLQRDVGMDVWGLGVVMYQCMTPAVLAEQARAREHTPTEADVTRARHTDRCHRGEGTTDHARIAQSQREAREEAFYLEHHLCGGALTALMEDLQRQSLEALVETTTFVHGSSRPTEEVAAIAAKAPTGSTHSPWASSIAFEAATRAQLLALGYTDGLSTLVAACLSPVPSRRPNTETILAQLQLGYSVERAPVCRQCALPNPQSTSPVSATGEQSVASAATREGRASSLRSASWRFMNFFTSTRKTQAEAVIEAEQQDAQQPVHALDTETPVREPRAATQEVPDCFWVDAAAVPRTGEDVDERRAYVFCAGSSDTGAAS